MKTSIFFRNLIRYQLLLMKLNQNLSQNMIINTTNNVLKLYN